MYDLALDTGARCPHHSPRYPDFCMSSIRETGLDLSRAGLCCSETGHIYLVGRAGSEQERGENQPQLDDQGNPILAGDTCQTFQRVELPDNIPSTSHPHTAARQGNLYIFGGNTSMEGPRFGYIWCSYDLQEFHTRYTESYKAGHSIWKTKLGSIEEEPRTGQQLHILDINTGVWLQFPDPLPFRLAGGATVWHLDKLYLIGGYTIEYDCELKSFYQSPGNTVWVFDPAVGRWAMGPGLPRQDMQDKTISFRGHCLGQATSHAGYIYYSGGACLAINNTFKVWPLLDNTGKSVQCFV